MTHWDSPRGRHSSWDDEDERDRAAAAAGPDSLAQRWQAYEAGRVAPPSPGSPQRPVSPAGPAGRPVSPARSGYPGRPVSPARPPARWPASRPPSGGGRSHWGDDPGLDPGGRQVIDMDEVEESEDDPPVRRRWALVALGSVIAGAAAGFAPEELRWANGLFGGEATTRTDAADTDPPATSRDTLPGNGSTPPAGTSRARGAPTPGRKAPTKGPARGA